MKHIDVSIIIVNFNTSKLILECIESIKKYTVGIAYEIIIVDNNSNPIEIEILKTIPINLKLCLLDKNIGFGQANNKGAQEAKGKILFFLNPDTLLINNSIKILFEFIITHPCCGACGGNLYDSEYNPNHSYNIRYPGFVDELDQVIKRKLSAFIDKGNTMFNHSGIPMKVAYITGADLMLRKSDFLRIGGFNPAFFMYYEETELQFRLHNIGFSIWSVPEAKIIHLEGKSFSISRDRELRYLISRRIYYKLTTNCIKQIGLDCFYKTITYIASGIAYLTNNNNLLSKMKQRISVLKQIQNMRNR